MSVRTIVREIPLKNLVPSPANVRRTRREIGIEELAASIAAHGVLQNLVVRPLANNKRAADQFEVIAGGRRLAAMNLLVKRKQMKPNAAVPCIIRKGDEVEETSLAENVVREPLHPADQYESFRRLHDDHGLGVEEIAARFGVTPHVVKQRLRLGAVSPMLMALYRDGSLSLDQLMAFTLTDDHARQDAVWDNLSWNKSPETIRRALSEAQVPTTDRRAVFVGVYVYEAAGGTVVRDLFDASGGGYLADPATLDRLAADKLAALADGIRAEGWKWLETSIDFPNAHGLRRIYPQPVALTRKQQARLDKLAKRHEALSEKYPDDDTPDEVAAELERLAGEIDEINATAYAYAPEDVARAGAFIAINHDGAARIERGFVRPADEPADDHPGNGTGRSGGHRPDAKDGRDPEPDEDDTRSGLSDRLVSDLTAHRTAGLRDALAQDPDVALLALTHALAVQTFYQSRDTATCLDLRLGSNHLGTHAAGIDDGAACRAISNRHGNWARQLPRDVGALWEYLVDLDPDSRSSLLAHCAALSVNAVQVPWERRPLVTTHADRLATALDLDMSRYWDATVEGYFGRITKSQIVDAVRDGASADAADRIAGHKKSDMAKLAADLLAGRNWLPELLRQPTISPPTRPLDDPSAAPMGTGADLNTVA